MCWTKAASNIMDDHQAAAVQKHLAAQTASRQAANTVPKSTDEAAAGIKNKRTARFLAMVLPCLGRTPVPPLVAQLRPRWAALPSWQAPASSVPKVYIRLRVWGHDGPFQLFKVSGIMGSRLGSSVFQGL